MLNKETVKNWLTKNNWLIMDDSVIETTGQKDDTAIYALAPSGLSVTFTFDKDGNYKRLNNIVEVTR